MSHAAHLVIDLAALQQNWTILAALAAAAQCGAAVKADAYGIGLEPAVLALTKAGCRSFFVAHTSEGVRLRTLSPDAHIFVLNGLEQGSETAVMENTLIPVLSSRQELQSWKKLRSTSNHPLAFALQFNLGMNRLGLSPDEIADIKQELTGVAPVLILGHFSSSEDPTSPSTERELAIFAKICAAFPNIPASLANSSAHFLNPVPKYDLTRPGYALYGGNPTPHLANPMRPVVSLTTPILQLRQLKAGETVGYNNLWTAKRPSVLATCSIGYADGLPRAARGTDAREGGAGFIDGFCCPIVGTISMDLTVFDVTDVPEPLRAHGANIEILGPHQSIDDLAASANTIGYEILTRLGSRYRRTYIGA